MLRCQLSLASFLLPVLSFLRYWPFPLWLLAVPSLATGPFLLWRLDRSLPGDWPFPPWRLGMCVLVDTRREKGRDKSPAPSARYCVGSYLRRVQASPSLIGNPSACTCDPCQLSRTAGLASGHRRTVVPYPRPTRRGRYRRGHTPPESCDGARSISLLVLPRSLGHRRADQAEIQQTIFLGRALEFHTAKLASHQN